MSQVDWTVPHDHPAFAGHFPHTPILPGVILLDMAVQVMADDGQLVLSHYLINSVKFLSPVQPGETLNINHSISSQGILSFNISANGRKIATGKITPKTPQTPFSTEDINT